MPRFQELKALETPPSSSFLTTIPQWMSKESIDIIDARATLRRYPNYSRNQACTLTWAVRKSLSTDSPHWAKMAAEVVDAWL